MSGDTNPGSARAKAGNAPASPAPTDQDDNSASTLIEAPVLPGSAASGPLKRHEFPDGGGSGGAEAFRRKPA